MNDCAVTEVSVQHVEWRNPTGPFVLAVLAGVPSPHPRAGGGVPDALVVGDQTARRGTGGSCRTRGMGLEVSGGHRQEHLSTREAPNVCNTTQTPSGLTNPLQRCAVALPPGVATDFRLQSVKRPNGHLTDQLPNPL